MLGHSACIEELQQRVCELGGDTLYGFSATRSEDENGLAGTVAYRTAAAPPSASSSPAANAADLCTPICSPGFACHAGACVPQCNPPCAAGETCNRHRTCEPTAAPAAPAAR